MGNELVPVAESGALAVAVEAAAGFIAASQAKNTKRAYSADWRHFHTWCERVNQAPLPAGPGTVTTYLSAMATAGAAFSTIRRRTAAIGDKHRREGHPNPVEHPLVKATLSGIARTIGSAPKKKAALTVDLVAKAARRIPTDLSGLRDRALILLGFAGALRRSELIGLDLEDLARHPKGLLITIRRSKSDQAGEGRTKAIPHGKRLRVVAAIDAWIAAAKITSGPLFRGVRGDRVLAGRLSDRQVARAVKKRAAAIGLDPKAFAAHSLRSGYITSADDHGVPIQRTSKHAGHAKLDTTLGYVQTNDAFRNSGKDFL